MVDEGVGIEPEHLSHLFDRFWRAERDRARNPGGTGLGLAIVKAIVGAHGGSVAVASQPGKGTTFTIRVPDFQTTADTAHGSAVGALPIIEGVH